MDEVSWSSRTVLFVSHNMSAISNLCPKSILLDAGTLLTYDVTETVIQKYIHRNNNNNNNIAEFRPHWAAPYITKIETMNSIGIRMDSFNLGEEITLVVSFSCPPNAPLTKPVLGVVINHNTRGVVGGVNMRMTGFDYPKDKYINGCIECNLKRTPLLQGMYTADLYIGDLYGDVDAIIGYISFSIEESNIYNSGKVPFSNLGVIFINPEWKIIDYE